MPHSVSTTLSDGLTATLTNPTAQAITYQPFIYPAVFGTVPASLVIYNSSIQPVYPTGPISAAVANGPVVTLAPGQSVSAIQVVSTKNDPGLTPSQGCAAAGHHTANAFFSVASTTSSVTSQPGTGTAGPLTVTAQ